MFSGPTYLACNPDSGTALHGTQHANQRFPPRFRAKNRRPWRWFHLQAFPNQLMPATLTALKPAQPKRQKQASTPAFGYL